MRRTLLLGIVLAIACTPPDSPAPMGMLDPGGDIGAATASLTAAQRRVRAGQIRDAAYAAGMTQGYLLAGIADAETNMSHCWSELTWACRGPNSSDCGGGPVVAGAGDGPCSLRQGGLGMFQFDAGTYDQTLAREGTRILSIAGNTQAAVDFVASMVVRSVYISGVDTRAQAIAWMNGVRVGNARWHPWIQTVTHYYNGCTPSGCSVYTSRYNHYRDNTRDVYNEMGATFWVVPSCTPSAETCNNRDDDCDGRIDDGVSRACSSACGSGTQACSAGAWGSCSAPAPRTETCNGADDDCDGSVDEGDLCEVALLNEQPAAYAPPRSTDVNADGRADLCARGYGGVRCWTASASGWSAPWAPIPWSDASGWDDVTNYATLRMGDLNADGRADVCARANAGVYCALSNGAGFEAASVWKDGLSDANGWNSPKLYTTLRLADVNGDGMDDLCARDAEGFGCWLSNGTAFDRRIEGPRWSDASGWGVAKHYGTIRMGDLNGDRRADVCARSASVVDCWLSNGDGFPTRVEGPRWSGGGWGSMSLWSTIRLIDYDGDGLGDLCARDTEALKCARGTGSGFEAEVVVAALSDASGWADRSNYATLRTGDVDGDGADDLCLRANAELYCWAFDGSAWTRRTGPAWSDDGSWNAPRYYQTIRLADFDGDGFDDVCARAGVGWRCHPSTGDGFGAAVTFDELTNDGGWVEPRYWSTILSAGHACRAEMESCNGRDDDCDGMIDEHAVAESCNGADDDCDGMIDEQAADESCNAADDDCDGTVDEGLSCGELPPTDGGTSAVDGGVTSRPDGGGTHVLSSGCACRASSGRADLPFGLALIGALMVAVRLRRR